MPDQAELNSLVVANLADLEAATLQLKEVVTPLVQDELLRRMAEFLDAHEDWAGETDAVTDVWLAPRRWHDAEGGPDEYLAFFELKASEARKARASTDQFWLSALTGTGTGKVGLYLVSDRLGDVRLGKLFASEPELVKRLQDGGFAYDVTDHHAVYLPIALDRGQLAADLRDDNLDAALAPLDRALEAAAASVALLDPLVARIAAAVDAR